MTAPAGLAAVQAQMSSLQAQIDALSAPAVASGTSGSASAFAKVLGQATPAASGTTSGYATSGYASSGAASGGSASPTAASGASGAAGLTGASGVTGASVVADAKKYLGIPYVWGGESTSGLDCSGLVQKTFSDLGIHLPRVAADQAHCGTAVASLAQAQPGDLLFFGNPAYHVAIYAGDGKLIESPEPGKTVHITDVYQTPTSIRRIVPAAGSVAGVSSPDSAAVPLASGVGRSAEQLTAAGLNPAVAAYAPQFAAVEQADGLPSGLLAAMCQQESGGNVRAVSPAGAQGLMQLMPSTAAAAGVDPFDPEQAIAAAGKIMARNLASFGGSVQLALAAYNAGAGAVHQYGGIPPYAETQNYVRRITAMMAAGG